MAASDTLGRELAAIATAIANARGGRRGAPAVGNILEVLPQTLLDEVVDDARAVKAALDALPPRPRPAGPLRVADADALRLDLGLDFVLVFAQDAAGTTRAAISTAGAPGACLGHRHASPLLIEVTQKIMALPDDAPEEGRS